MAFFSQSSNFTINDGSFSEIKGDCFNIHITTQEPAGDVVRQILGKRKDRDDHGLDGESGGPKKRLRRSSRNEDGLMVVKVDDVYLRRELVSGKSYRIHSASHDGRTVAVKVFAGPHAQQDWRVNMAVYKKFLHSNVLKIIGVSDETSGNPFLVFHGMIEKRLQSVIAKALRTDLSMSIRLSMKAVKGLAAGLSYMSAQKVSIHAGTASDSGLWENFDIFAGENDEAVIAFHPPSTISQYGGSSLDIVHESDGIAALTGLCQKLFTAAHSILYDDSPEREFDQYDAGILPTSLQNSVGSSDILEDGATSVPLGSADKPKLKRPPRREVWWLDKGAKNRTLDSISRRFEDYLDCYLGSSSNHLLRRIRGSQRVCSGQTSHQCPGYLREEITLTPDVARSAIISHEYPSQSELCSMCGQLVQYGPPDNNSSNTDSTEHVDSDPGPTPDPQSRIFTIPPSNVVGRTSVPPVRAKSGCYTCRIRRKKCDGCRIGNEGSCETCLRLKLECLGFGQKRPEFLRDVSRVSQIRDRIKVHLVTQNLIKAGARPGSPNSDMGTLRISDYHGGAAVDSSGEDDDSRYYNMLATPAKKSSLYTLDSGLYTSNGWGLDCQNYNLLDTPAKKSSLYTLDSGLYTSNGWGLDCQNYNLLETPAKRSSFNRFLNRSLLEQRLMPSEHVTSFGINPPEPATCSGVPRPTPLFTIDDEFWAAEAPTAYHPLGTAGGFNDWKLFSAAVTATTTK